MRMKHETGSVTISRTAVSCSNRHVFNGIGYDGDNISPHLMWDDVPAGTKKLCGDLLRSGCADRLRLVALVVANLPADTRVLPQGAGSGQAELPEEAVQTRTGFW